MHKERYFIYTILMGIVIIAFHKIVDICILKHDEYLENYASVTERYYSGMSAPRGRILDVNGKVLVDNIGVNTVIYNNRNTSKKEKLSVSNTLAKILEIDENRITEQMLKSYYLLIHDDGEYLISDEEKELYRERKLNRDDIESLKMSRVDDEKLSELSETDKNAAYIYNAISKGYAFDSKVIKKGVTSEESAKVSELNLEGIEVVLSWERIYPYGNTLRSIFGSVSDNSLPKELKDYYQEKGISLNSSVGTSFLELQYDDYLRGKDAKYVVSQTGLKRLIEEETPGADLYLSIDIDKQLEVENILKEEMLAAKKAKNTEYYNHSYVIVGHPKTGEIVAAVGLMLNNGHFSDITSNIISSSYTVGSIVKGASMSVGYANDLIDKGKYVTDSCVKVYGVQEKCSWKRLGRINDISAMAMSSNYFQFLIAIKLTNPSYKWNSKLNATKEHFDIYRDMFSSYGLGTITGIDLPNERVGIIGNKVSDDLILNLSIGQYDTYTPIEVFQYINSIANDGVRLKPTLMKRIESNGDIVKEMDNTPLNEAKLDEDDMKRVQEGMRAVMTSGLGKNYFLSGISSAGKTGTSETFIDSDGDGRIDTKTISTAFVMYAPYDNPEYSIVIMSPNISHRRGNNSYNYGINLRINKKISSYLFEKL